VAFKSKKNAQLRDEGIALLKLMNFAERDVKAGRTIDTVQAKKSIREFFQSGKIELTSDSYSSQFILNHPPQASD
jgi:hypothetical protein